MKSITQIKSLSDMRTAISAHVPTRQPQRGTAYLNIYLLDMERQRLNKELYMLERRQKRILTRLAEIQSAIENLDEAKVAPTSPGVTGLGKSEPGAKQGGQQWKKLSIDY